MVDTVTQAKSGDQWNSLPTMFFDQAATYPGKPLLYAKNGDRWTALTWSQVSEQIARLTRALRSLGVKKGDRVVLVSENRPEWLIADFAIMAAGAVTVPTYTTYTSRDYAHILGDSGAKVGIISSKALALRVLRAGHESDEFTDAIVMEDPKFSQSLNVNIHCYDDVMGGDAPDVAMLKSEQKDLTRDDLACIIYTSGTGGAPKGVMLHHGAMLANVESVYGIIEMIGVKNNSFLSFLPLSHAYEHTAGHFLAVSIAADIWYAESIDKLAANMAEASPTIMVVVPRLFEMLRLRLLRQIEKESAIKRALFEQTLSIGMKLSRGEDISLWERVQLVFLNATVKKQVKKRFGGRIKALVAGGAPLSPDLGHFFAALGLPLLQGYGQTESAPVISVNPPGAAKMHTVGKVLDGVDCKIADDGEILVRGELVMKGYWNLPSATEKTIIDGWLHTGDVGHFDSDGYLEITDRKKDIIVNDKGDNVSPQRIEGLLALEEEIAQAMIYGDRQPHLVGLIVPDPEWFAQWKKDSGKTGSLQDLAGDTDLRKALDNAVSRVNQRLTNVEKIRKFTLADEAFSVDNEQMTPTLKVRRHVVVGLYKDRLEALYGH